MDLYEKIKQISPEAKADADAFMKKLTGKYTPEKPAPPEEIQKGLESVLAMHQGTQTKSESQLNERWKYAVGLGAIGILLGYIPYLI